MNTKLHLLLVTLGLAALSAAAQVPGLISHQGKVTVNGTNFNGSGQFKFAFVNAAGDTTWWSNDGTGAGGGAPTNAVALPVTRGIFSVNLGDTTLANMTPIPASVFNNSAVYLRTWFNDGATGWQQFSPDVRITSVGYALRADSANETDPVFTASVAYGITSGQVGHWNTAYGWGNHATAGYLTSFTETDPLFTASPAHGIAVGDITAWNAKAPSTRSISTTAPLTGGGSLASDLTLGLPAASSTTSGYLTSTDWNKFNSSGGLGGSGTVNYVPKFTAASTVGNSLIYDNGTSVGISTNSPRSTYALDVNGSAGVAGYLMVDSLGLNDGNLWPSIIFGAWGSTSGIASKRTAGGNQYGLDFYTLGANRMCIAQGGNVGIGTTVPNAGKLHIANAGALYLAVDNQNTTGSMKAGVSFGSYNRNRRWEIGQDINENATDQFYIWHSADGSVPFSINSSGYVGIGTQSPGVSLEVNGGIHARGGTPGAGGYNNGYAFWGNGGDNDSGMFSTSDGVVSLFANNAEALQVNSGGTVVMGNFYADGGSAYFQGWVGIGRSASCPLDVNGSANLNIGSFTFYPRGGITGGTSGYGDVSIRSNGRMVASEFDATSDARIKNIVARTDTLVALDRVNQLQITDYTYIDQPELGSQRHVGVIAQEAQAVAPNVVATNTDFIPNIFALADGTSYDPATQRLTVLLSQAHGVVVGDMVRFAGAIQTMTKTVVAVPDANTFVVSEVPAAEPDVFVIGKQVKDLLTVNYQDLFATGLAAIQELTKQNAELRRRLEALEAKLGQ